MFARITAISLAAVTVAAIAGCGNSMDVSATGSADTATVNSGPSPASTAVTPETVESSAPARPQRSKPKAKTDPRGDANASLDLTSFRAAQNGDSITITWVLAAPPNGTLVSARTPSYAIAAVKIYPNASDGVADAYVFTDTNKYLSEYTVRGNTVTLTLPASDLGGFPVTLTASTERVGGQAGDEGPTVTVR